MCDINPQAHCKITFSFLQHIGYNFSFQLHSGLAAFISSSSPCLRLIQGCYLKYQGNPVLVLELTIMLKSLQIIIKLKPVTTFVTRSSKKASHTSSLRRCFDIATWTRIKWSSNETDCASGPHLSLKKSLSEADLMLGV